MTFPVVGDLVFTGNFNAISYGGMTGNLPELYLSDSGKTIGNSALYCYRKVERNLHLSLKRKFHSHIKDI